MFLDVFDHISAKNSLILYTFTSGALAMEALHKQVLPFILRRMKEDVLKDLPPKIIQDYYCDLSPLQVRPIKWAAPCKKVPNVLSGRASPSVGMTPTF